ncbi:MAG: hypothetical protein ACXVPU_15910 [Bacteroidia bacterium]
MKRSFKILIKGLLVIVLFTTGNIVLSGAGVKTVSEANANLSCQNVHDYLVAQGYIVYTVNVIQGTTNFAATTQLRGINYNTTVYSDGMKITEVANVPM